MSHIIDNIRVTGVKCPLCQSKDTVMNPTEDGGLRMVCRSCDKKGETRFVAYGVEDVDAEIDTVVERRADVPLVKQERVRGSHTTCAICESTPGLCAIHAEGYEEEPRYTRSSAATTGGEARESPEAPAGPQIPGESLSEASTEVRAAPSRGIGQR